MQLEGLHAQIPVVGRQRSAELLALVEKGDISGKMAKDVLRRDARDRQARAQAIIEARGLAQVSDTAQIEQAVRAVHRAEPGQRRGVPRRQDQRARLLRRSGDEGDRRARRTRKLVNEMLQKLLDEAP